MITALVLAGYAAVWFTCARLLYRFGPYMSESDRLPVAAVSLFWPLIVVMLMLWMAGNLPTARMLTTAERHERERAERAAVRERAIAAETERRMCHDAAAP